MLLIYDTNGSNASVIRPCPLITINYTVNRNKASTLGGTYEITLNGTIIAHEGSPLISNASSLSNGSVNPAENILASYRTSYEPKPAGQAIAIENRLGAILAKQNAIRELFSVDGRKMEICGVHGDEPLLTFYPSVESVSFEEGIYVDICRYTVILRADFLLDYDQKIISDGKILQNFDPTATGNAQLNYNGNNAWQNSGRLSISDHLQNIGGAVEDFSDSWSIEEAGDGITTNPFNAPHENVIKTYRLTRNISATGRTVYTGEPNKARKEAWEQAHSFVHKQLKPYTNNSEEGYKNYPYSKLSNTLASGIVNLNLSSYGGYNYSFTENIDRAGGIYSVTETWLLCSGLAYENYSMSINSSIDQANPTIQINGTIKGMSSIHSSGTIYGGNTAFRPSVNSVAHQHNTPYENAMFKYQEITNTGTFGLTSHIYKRAQNLTNLTVNPFPTSLAIGVNEFSGEITYDIQLDTRPLLNIPGTISENISITDTYPGDVFATIPVLGRPTGPILQYLGTRTEYRRDVGIDLIFAANSTTTTAAPSSPSPLITTTPTPSTLRQAFLFDKPTLWNPARDAINNLIKALSPAYEIGVRKYFLNPPTETWDPKERRYTINLSWTYELDH